MDSRPNISNLFRAANANSLTNSKHKRLFQSLQWRQAFEHSEFYEYSMENGKKFSVRQIPNGEMKGLGTGTFVWPAAHILAKYFEKKFGQGGLEGKTICDIGSGTGLTGFIAALLGGSVTLTDQSCVLSLLNGNVEDILNAGLELREDRLVVKEYDWSGKVALSVKPFDFLIVSDCVLPKLYPIDILLEAVDFVMGKETIAYFSYEHRPFPKFDPRQEFQRLCSLKGLEVHVVPMSEHHSVYCAEDIEIWEVRRQDAENRVKIKSNNFCLFSSWGEEESIVSVQLDGLDLVVKQAPGQGIGGVLWPSSAIASRIIVGSKFTLIRDRLFLKDGRKALRAIDLGAGCGLTTLALHRRGFEVVATDKLGILPLLKENVESYLGVSEVNTSIPIRVVDFAWENVSTTHLEQEEPFDLIVCSDCLYNSSSIEPLLESIEKLIDEDVCVLLVNELRTALEEFFYLARRRLHFDVDIKEIEVTQPELELVRNNKEVKFAPPIRACVMHWHRKKLGE